MNTQKAKTGELGDKLTKEFGRILRKERERRGISQEKLAKMMGISRPYCSKLETGGKRIHINHLADWCAAMHISPMTVLEKWARSKYAKEIVKERMKEYKRTIEEMIEFGFYSELDTVMEVFAQMVKIEKSARKKTAERQRKQIKLEF
jgi:transcriptional regulator with XRE-family HTH domain